MKQIGIEIRRLGISHLNRRIMPTVHIERTKLGFSIVRVQLEEKDK